VKIGDLVVYRVERGKEMDPIRVIWANLPGVVVRQIPGTDEVQCVRWMDGNKSALPKRRLMLYRDRGIGSGLQ